MRVLWAPWRIDYILGPKPDACALCVPSSDHEDDARHILYRGRDVFVIMNKYPYNNGHLMVVPYRHVMDIAGLTTEEAAEIMALLALSRNMLQEAMHPQGFNVGLNLGEAAGAGIRDHLHFHIVPRWNGDSSFMAVMNETRIIPEHLDSTYRNLKPLFARHEPGQTA